MRQQIEFSFLVFVGVKLHNANASLESAFVCLLTLGDTLMETIKQSKELNMIMNNERPSWITICVCLVCSLSVKSFKILDIMYWDIDNFFFDEEKNKLNCHVVIIFFISRFDYLLANFIYFRLPPKTMIQCEFGFSLLAKKPEIILSIRLLKWKILYFVFVLISSLSTF